VRVRNAYRELTVADAEVGLMKGADRLNQVPPDAQAIFERNVRTMVDVSLSGGAAVILSSFATLHELDPDALLNGMTTLKEHKLFSLLHFTPGLSLRGIFTGIARYKFMLRNISITRNTAWVDNAMLIESIDDNFLDCVHLSKNGVERMARNFLPAVPAQFKRE
jgi:hypothetical protein